MMLLFHLINVRLKLDFRDWVGEIRVQDCINHNEHTSNFGTVHADFGHSFGMTGYVCESIQVIDTVGVARDMPCICTPFENENLLFNAPQDLFPFAQPN
jgi:hypothetical protein